MSNKSGNSSSGPGSRTRRKMSGELQQQQGLSKNKCKELIQDMLISNGHREMLKRLIQSRLAQSGWTYTMRQAYIDYIKQKGIENVNVSHMIADTVPKGVEIFPESVRNEIEDLLWNFATEFISIDDSLTPAPETDTSFSELYNFVYDGVNTDDHSLRYQSRDAIPDPGIGFNVTTPEIHLSRTPSPTSVPRPLTPQPSIPILKPENIKSEIKEELIVEHDEEEDLSATVDDEQQDEVEEEEEPADDEELAVPISSHNIESEEEELMDV